MAQFVDMEQKSSHYDQENYIETSSMNQPLKIEYSKKFWKQFSRLNPKIREQFKVRQRLWVNDPYHPQLHLHMLTGEYAGLYSINISGDIRALYEKVGDNYIIFGFIGTHSQLYG